MDATLIVNTKARNGRERFEQARACLQQNGVNIQAAHALEDSSQLPDRLKESVSQGAKLVVIGGGDGTFRCAAGILAHTEVTLGVLPLGTVNDFARNLGIEPNVEAACKAVAGGKTARIDIGMANDEYFLITASLGFSAQSQMALTPGLKKVFGPFGYLVASLRALHQLRHLRMRVHCREADESCAVVQAGVVKGHSWMGGKFEIPGLSLEEGRLAFYAVPPYTKVAFFRIARSLMHGRFFHTPGLRSFLVKEILIETERPQPLVLDGDLCGYTPVHLRVIPDAMRVCVPEDYDQKKELPAAYPPSTV